MQYKCPTSFCVFKSNQKTKCPVCKHSCVLNNEEELEESKEEITRDEMTGDCDGETLFVVSWNMQKKGSTDGLLDLLTLLNCDVAFIQEPHRVFRVEPEPAKKSRHTRSDERTDYTWKYAEHSDCSVIYRSDLGVTVGEKSVNDPTGMDRRVVVAEIAKIVTTEKGSEMIGVTIASCHAPYGKGKNEKELSSRQWVLNCLDVIKDIPIPILIGDVNIYNRAVFKGYQSIFASPTSNHGMKGSPLDQILIFENQDDIAVCGWGRIHEESKGLWPLDKNDKGAGAEDISINAYHRKRIKDLLSEPEHMPDHIPIYLKLRNRKTS